MEINKEILIGIIVGLLFISGTYWFFQIDLVDEGFNFCNDKGYESTSILGSYNEMYGKVECISCYGGNCIMEEFNVTKKFGIIKEVRNR